MISSSVELVTQLVDLVFSLVNPTLHLKSEPKVVDPSSSSINSNPPLRSVAQVVDPVLSSIDPTPPLRSDAKVVTLSPSSDDPTPHSKSEDVSQDYLINTDSPGKGGTLPISIAPPSSTHIIYINWNHLKEPHLPSYIPFQITM
jgi:hypothetical protein